MHVPVWLPRGPIFTLVIHDPSEGSVDGVWYPTPERIGPQAAFIQLSDVLLSLPVLDGVSRRRQGAPAHMTIAEFLSVADSEDLAARLDGRVPEGAWMCQEIAYAIPDAQFRFQRVRALCLGR